MKKTFRTAICAVAKQENRFIREWADYHLDLGFDSIYVCDNNDPGDLSTAELFNGCPDVTVLDFRGRKKFQLDAYNSFYEKEGASFDWIAFIDIDEFITFSPDSGYRNIHDYLDDAGDADIVCLSWMTYGDNGKTEITDDSIFSRFPEPVRPYSSVSDNVHVKVIARPRLGLEFIYNPHSMEGRANRVNGSFKPVPGPTPFLDPDYSKAYIRHYGSKTIGEFIKNKIMRGAADSDSPDIYRLPLFYRWNRRTLKKRRIEIRMCGLKTALKMDLYMLYKSLGLKKYAERIRF